jgi:hypothetical protein
VNTRGAERVEMWTEMHLELTYILEFCLCVRIYNFDIKTELGQIRCEGVVEFNSVKQNGDYMYHLL